MAAPGGPDDDTWKRMSPSAKAVYWVLVALFCGLFAYLALK
jgi:hypothetical protein